jgi:hypothetical protein
MALDARQVPLPGPTAIAIHDDRHVPWQRGLGFGTEMGNLRAHGFRRQVTDCPAQVKTGNPKQLEGL